MATPSPTHYFLLSVLKDTRQELLEALNGLSEAQASSKPDPARWSPLECLEHIAVVEDRFLGWIANGEPDDSPVTDSMKEQSLLLRVTDRSVKAQAPESAQPSGRFPTLAEAIAAFEAARERTVQITRARGQELYGVRVKHPRFGEMNGVELLHILAGHCRRHAAQIRETRAAS